MNGSIMGYKACGGYTLVYCCFSFAVGAVLLRFKSELWSVWVYAAVIVLLVLLFIVWRRSAILWAGMIGFAWAGFMAANLLKNELPRELEKTDIVVHGEVIGVVEKNETGGRFVFRIDQLNLRDEILKSPGRVRLNVYKLGFVPDTGETWRYTVRLKRRHGLQNFGAGFNYETWLFQQRILATGYVVSGQQITNSATPSGGFWSSVHRLRLNFSQFISQQLDDTTAVALLSALSVGVRSSLTPSDWEVLQRTGTVHLVAISGLHVGLVALLGALFVGLLWRCSSSGCRRFPAPYAGLVGALCFGTSYAVLAGLTVPTQRAVLMLAALVLIKLFRKHIPIWAGLGIVLSLMIVMDPLVAFSSSFWLSFSAVLVLMLGAGGKTVPSSGPFSLQRWRRTTLSWINIQWWLLIGMLPVVALAFQRVSLVAPLANMLAVPCIGFAVVPLGLLGLVSWWTGFENFAYVLVKAAAMMISFIWQYLESLSALNWASHKFPTPTIFESVFAFSAILVFRCIRSLHGAIILSFWFIPIIIPTRDDLGPHEFRYSMLDVGQGLASVVTTQNHVLVFDAGAHYKSGFNLASAVVVPYLRYRGTSKIDKFFVSHNDNDHQGGEQFIRENFAIIATYRGEKEQGQLGKYCVRGQDWEWDGVEFDVIWPLENGNYQGNSGSCVVRVRSRYGSLLITGDIEKIAEVQIARDFGSEIDVDVLQAPHHGSKTSSTTFLLDHATPKLALVSAGYLNRFQHPHYEVVKRYHDRGITIINTATSGAIEVVFASDGLGIETSRRKAKKFWIKDSDFW